LIEIIQERRFISWPALAVTVPQPETADLAAVQTEAHKAPDAHNPEVHFEHPVAIPEAAAMNPHPALNHVVVPHPDQNPDRKDRQTMTAKEDRPIVARIVVVPQKA
jgi:hypothetical protein